MKAGCTDNFMTGQARDGLIRRRHNNAENSYLKTLKINYFGIMSNRWGEIE